MVSLSAELRKGSHSISFWYWHIDERTDGQADGRADGVPMNWWATPAPCLPDPLMHAGADLNCCYLCVWFYVHICASVCECILCIIVCVCVCVGSCLLVCYLIKAPISLGDSSIPKQPWSWSSGPLPSKCKQLKATSVLIEQTDSSCEHGLWLMADKPDMWC